MCSAWQEHCKVSWTLCSTFSKVALKPGGPTILGWHCVCTPAEWIMAQKNIFEFEDVTSMSCLPPPPRFGFSESTAADRPRSCVAQCVCVLFQTPTAKQIFLFWKICERSYQEAPSWATNFTNIKRQKKCSMELPVIWEATRTQQLKYSDWNAN